MFETNTDFSRVIQGIKRGKTSFIGSGYQKYLLEIKSPSGIHPADHPQKKQTNALKILGGILTALYLEKFDSRISTIRCFGKSEEVPDLAQVCVYVPIQNISSAVKLFRKASEDIEKTFDAKRVVFTFAPVSQERNERAFLEETKVWLIGFLSYAQDGRAAGLSENASTNLFYAVENDGDITIAASIWAPDTEELKVLLDRVTDTMERAKLKISFPQ